MSKSRWIAGVVSAAALLASVSASATTLEKLSFGDMVSSAAACVTGEAISSTVVVRDGQAYTQTEFRVTKTAFGSTAGTITVEAPGGERSLGRLRTVEIVAGSPKFFNQQETLLLVTPNASGMHTVVGFNQGAFPVVGGSVSLPNGVGVLNVDKALDMISAERSNPGSDQVAE